VDVARSPLRVLPAPDSLQARAEALAVGWARADEPDLCVDAEGAISSGCSTTEPDVAAMPASERRAIRLTRQRIRAQAILAAEEPSPAQARRDRARRWGIVIGSAALHLVGFFVLASAVADLRAKPRPATHEHLFDARAIVAIEPAPMLASKLEPAVDDSPPDDQPVTRSQPSRKPKPRARHDHAEPPSTSEAAPYELRGFEFSSEGELAAGEPGGESFGRPGGEGSGHGGGDEQPREQGPGEPDVSAKPRGGLLQPEYPAALERKGVEGSVLVKVWIDEHGHVIKAEVVESSGEEAFDHNALMTAQRQEWTAAEQGGEAVASTRRYRVHFRQRAPGPARLQ
jgi:TonB family protein